MKLMRHIFIKVNPRQKPAASDNTVFNRFLIKGKNRALRSSKRVISRTLASDISRGKENADYSRMKRRAFAGSILMTFVHSYADLKIKSRSHISSLTLHTNTPLLALLPLLLRISKSSNVSVKISSFTGNAEYE